MAERETRTVFYADQAIRYQLERKKVKNINLRIRRDGAVFASAPPRVPAAVVDEFVLKKAAFVLAAQRRFLERSQRPAEPRATYTDQQCRQVFGEILEELYPIFKPYGVAMPTLKIRDMKTRWGTCHVTKGVITLNKRLMNAPRGCIEYVAVHEYCHFLHPNHSKAFYQLLSSLMPDWQERRAALNDCAACWQ